jgi:hypothetical protein
MVVEMCGGVGLSPAVTNHPIVVVVEMCGGVGLGPAVISHLMVNVVGLI